jgi:hypothetical protein
MSTIETKKPEAEQHATDPAPEPVADAEPTGEDDDAEDDDAGDDEE